MDAIPEAYGAGEGVRVGGETRVWCAGLQCSRGIEEMTADVMAGVPRRCHTTARTRQIVRAIRQNTRGPTTSGRPCG